MGMNRVSPTEWRVEIACADYNDSFEVQVTAEGIEINFNLITWDELADARRFFTMKDS